MKRFEGEEGEAASVEGDKGNGGGRDGAAVEGGEGNGLILQHARVPHHMYIIISLHYKSIPYISQGG